MYTYVFVILFLFNLMKLFCNLVISWERTRYDMFTLFEVMIAIFKNMQHLWVKQWLCIQSAFNWTGLFLFNQLRLLNKKQPFSVVRIGYMADKIQICLQCRVIILNPLHACSQPLVRWKERGKPIFWQKRWMRDER